MPLRTVSSMDGSLVPEPPISTIEPDLAAVKASRPDQSASFFGPNVIEICRLADICYLGLHGGCGENGQVQAALDMESSSQPIFSVSSISRFVV